MNERAGKITSVEALFSELNKVVSSKGVSSHPQICIESLARQSRTAAISIPALSIYEMVLNTFKDAADASETIKLDVPGDAGVVVLRGFNAFDRLRRLALRAMKERENLLGSSSPRNKVGLQLRLDAANKQIATQDEDLVHMTLALETAIEKLRAYASQSKNPALKDKLESDIKEISSFFTLVNNEEISSLFRVVNNARRSPRVQRSRD